MSKTVLVTGGAGFIGSNFISYLLKNTDYNIVNIDCLTYASKCFSDSMIDKPRLKNYLMDITSSVEVLDNFLERHNVGYIVHFAAESHVDNSIRNPSRFIETNINGTFNLLEAATNWGVSKFIHISTDEVYGSIKEGQFTESSLYKPNSPYSASKAASDLLCRSYHKTFDLPVIITHCSNNYGPRQHPEKLIPTVIRKCYFNRPIPVYGNGKNIRDWIHVEDHCSAICEILQNGKDGEVYNIGGNNEIENIEIVKQICSLMDELSPKTFKHEELIEYVDDRLGHDWRYAIDNTKINNELNWKPSKSFIEGIKDTVSWYLEQLNKGVIIEEMK